MVLGAALRGSSSGTSAPGTWALPASSSHTLIGAYRRRRPDERNIVIAWVLTVPVTVFLGALIFGAGFLIVFRASSERSNI